MITKKAVVLLSGGIDSSTTLAIAKSEDYELYALTFDYHQRHRRELESAKMVASELGVRKIMTIGFDLREIGGSALTSGIEVPKLSPEGFAKKEAGKSEGVSPVSAPRRVSAPDIPVTYVPARNTIFLSFALAWAEVLGAEDIFIGANAVDYSGYPDCRPEYLKAFEDMANLAVKASVEGKMRFRIKTPLLYMTKGEIIKKGMELGLDYSLTWSCYDPQKRKRKGQTKITKAPVAGSPGRQPAASSYVPCGRCDSCLYRAKGFLEAETKDPLR